MKFKIKKIDKRYTGGLFFKYIAIPDIKRTNLTGLYFVKRTDEEIAFLAARKWCWNTWGPSCELRFFKQDLTNRHLYDEDMLEPTWGWETEHDKLRIYFKTDKEASWFSLKWAGQ